MFDIIVNILELLMMTGNCLICYTMYKKISEMYMSIVIASSKYTENNENKINIIEDNINGSKDDILIIKNNIGKIEEKMQNIEGMTMGNKNDMTTIKLDIEKIKHNIDVNYVKLSDYNQSLPLFQKQLTLCDLNDKSDNSDNSDNPAAEKHRKNSLFRKDKKDKKQPLLKLLKKKDI